MKNRIGSAAAVGLVGSLLMASVAFAQTTLTPTPGSTQYHTGSRMNHAPGVFGTVSAVNGTTLTVTSKGFGQNATATTYTVDASNATVTKGGAPGTTPTTIPVSSIAIGDMVMVAGTVSGTSVTATTIRDGMPQGMGRGAGMKGGWGKNGSTTPSNLPQGNGQPVVGGAVTAISGDSITITNTSNVTYTIDATNATVTKGNTTSSLSNIAVGDNLVVQGTVNGNAVTASSIIDGGAPKTSTSGGTSHAMGGFMGAVGGFFHKLFGFF